MKISRSFVRTLRFSPVLVSLGAALSLTGCPSGADLEDPNRFIIAGAGGTGTGGTGTGGTGTGGSSGGMAGSAGSPPLVIAGAPNCAWQEGLTRSCAISSCHQAPRATLMPYAGLNLVPDADFVNRVKDVPVTLRDVDCDPGPSYVACIPPEPPACQPFAGKKLIDSENPMESFLITKLDASGCGNPMPLAPGNESGRGWSDERKQCLIDLFVAIAALP